MQDGSLENLSARYRHDEATFLVPNKNIDKLDLPDWFELYVGPALNALAMEVRSCAGPEKLLLISRQLPLPTATPYSWTGFEESGAVAVRSEGEDLGMRLVAV